VDIVDIAPVLVHATKFNELHRAPANVILIQILYLLEELGEPWSRYVVTGFACTYFLK